MAPVRAATVALAVCALTLAAVWAAITAPIAGATPWALTSVPVPPVVAGTLSAVSCPPSGACVGVGSGSDGTDFAEVGAGGSWQLADDGLRGPVGAISCPGAGVCIAVGSRTGTGSPLAAIDRFAHGRWHGEHVPLPRGATAVTLAAVSCASGRACLAVGSVTSAGHTGLLVLRYDGRRWRRVPIVTPLGPAPALYGVSCAGPRWCEIVGGESRTGPDANGAGTSHAVNAPLIYLWNGRRLILGELDRGLPGSRLTAISCPQQGVCEAVGDSEVGAFAERLANGTWTLQPVGVELPSQETRLAGVDCSSAGSCVAVGSHGGDAEVPDEVGIGELYSHGRWRLQEGGVWNQEGGLAGVSCPAQGRCSAVGFAGPPADAEPLALSYGRRQWAPQTTQSPIKPSSGQLYAESCLPGSCMVVGTTTGPEGVRRTLAERFDGQRWTILPTPNPTADANWGLDGVSCPTAQSCVAVGYGPAGIVIERWDGSSWTIDPSATGSPGDQLAAVSCSAPGVCTAVGDTLATGLFGELVLHDSGSGWSPQASPDTSGGTLRAVACPAADACVAVGDRAGNVQDTSEQPLTETWDGNSWTVATSPHVDGGGKLMSVACPAVGGCLSVGDQGDANGGAPSPLAETFDGTADAGVSVPVPASGAGVLKSVSCAGPATCEAVGSITGAGVTTTFAAAWDGTAWTLEAPPNLLEIDPHTGAPEPAASQLNAVGCAAPGYCLAVGASGTAPADTPLAELGS